MTFQSKSTQLMTKLVRLTSEDKIKWELTDPPTTITLGTDDVIPLFFHAEYKDKYVAIYQQRCQSFIPEKDSTYWYEQIIFAILDDHGRVIWENSEHSRVLVDLMETVREKAAGIDELLDDLISDED